MATIQFFTARWVAASGALLPGQSLNWHTGIISGEDVDVSLTVTAQARRTEGNVVYSVGVRDVNVVTNIAPPGGLSLNFRTLNTHATKELASLRVSYCVIF